jgi:hypothetical protein
VLLEVGHDKRSPAELGDSARSAQLSESRAGADRPRMARELADARAALEAESRLERGTIRSGAIGGARTRQNETARSKGARGRRGPIQREGRTT